MWGCWQVEREKDKKDWAHEGFSKDVPGGKKNHSVNHVKHNAHIRYSSYLTKLCLIFILAKFALVFIQAIQFSISGSWWVVFTLKMSHLFWVIYNDFTRSLSSQFLQIHYYQLSHIIPLLLIQVSFYHLGEFRIPFILSA